MILLSRDFVMMTHRLNALHRAVNTLRKHRMVTAAFFGMRSFQPALQVAVLER